MAYLSTYAADKALDALLRNVPYTSTPTYLAAFTLTPTMPAGTNGVEVTGGSYGRQRVDTALAASAFGQTSNSSAITFAQATANWGTIVGLGVFDALTGGNLLAAVPLRPVAVGSGQTLTVPIADLDILLS